MTDMTEFLSWSLRGACLKLDPDTMFVQGAAQNRAKLTCFGCPVQIDCLAEALDNHIEFGVWGGKTERERRALLRKKPDVPSWRAVLDAARRRHGGEAVDLPVYVPKPAPTSDPKPPREQPTPHPPQDQRDYDRAVLGLLDRHYPPDEEHAIVVGKAAQQEFGTTAFKLRAAISRLEAAGLLSFRPGLGSNPSRITLHSQPDVTRETSLSG